MRDAYRLAFLLVALGACSPAVDPQAGGDGHPPNSDGTCNTAISLCAGTCVDLTSNPRDCGSCGNECAVGQRCAGGACTGAFCVPGQQVACACLGGGAGVQVCKSDGSGLDACNCPSTVDGGSAPPDLFAAIDLAQSPADLAMHDLSIVPGKPLSFLAARDFPVSRVQSGLIVGDVDGDKKLDVIAGCRLLLGKGDGTFAPSINIGSGLGTVYAMGDVNGDGKPDLVLTDYATSAFGVALNMGNGTFGAVAKYANPFQSGGSALLADLNGDGKADLVELSGGGPSVLMNEGSGTFATPVLYSWKNGAGSAMAIGDVTGDGKLDLVIGSEYDPTQSVVVLPGRGDGTFGAALFYPGPIIPSSIALGDLNGDGKLDIAVTGGQGNGVVAVLLNSGSGFLAATNYTIPGYTKNVQIGDVTGDGKADLVLGGVSLMVNQGNGTFSAIRPISAASIVAMTLADLDGDSRLDIVAVDLAMGWEQDVIVFHNAGNGAFVTAQSSPAGPAPSTLAIADLDGDGHPDVVLPSLNGNTMNVLMGKSGGTFAAPVSYVAGNNSPSVAIGDLNGDGAPDVAVANRNGNGASVLLNQGKGTFAAEITYPAGTAPSAIQIADIDGDKKPDLIVANSGSNNVSVLRNLGTTTFASAVNYAVGMSPSALAIGDLDGDGKPDIVVLNPADNDVSVLHNQGSGAFAAAVSVPVGSYLHVPSGVALGDLDGDGRLDLVVSIQTTDNPNPTQGDMEVFLNSGSGMFGSAIHHTIDFAPGAIALADLDGDGRLDVTFVSPQAGSVGLMANVGGGQLAAPVYYAGASLASVGVATADVTGDHLVDLIVADALGTCNVLVNATH